MSIRAKYKVSTVAEYSDVLVKAYELPYGIELRLYNKASERQARSDKTLKRKGLNKKTKEVFIDELHNVRDFLDFVKSLLTVDIESKFKFKLHAPDGSNINGGTLLKNVKKLEPKTREYDSENELAAFFKIMADCDCIDLTVRQLGQLYHHINEATANGFSELLLNQE
jgi:ribosomal protein L30/L7E